MGVGLSSALTPFPCAKCRDGEGDGRRALGIEVPEVRFEAGRLDDAGLMRSAHGGFEMGVAGVMAWVCASGCESEGAVKEGGVSPCELSEWAMKAYPVDRTNATLGSPLLAVPLSSKRWPSLHSRFPTPRPSFSSWYPSMHHRALLPLHLPSACPSPAHLPPPCSFSPPTPEITPCPRFGHGKWGVQMAMRASSGRL